MSAGTSAGALPINQMEQGKENMTDGQDKSLMENLTCCCTGWQWQEEAKKEETGIKLEERTVMMASKLSSCPFRYLLS